MHEDEPVEPNVKSHELLSSVTLLELAYESYADSPSSLSPFSWRSRSDPLADQALDSLKHLETNSSLTSSSSGDLLARLSSINSSLQSSTSNSNPLDPNLFSTSEVITEAHQSDLKTFWDSIDRRPPIGCGALDESWYKERENRWSEKWEDCGGIETLRVFCGQVEEAECSEDWNSWSPPKKRKVEMNDQTKELLKDMLEEELEAEEIALEAGRNVFYRYAGPLLLSLLHFSLAGGFSSPRITNVLKETGYLVPGHKKNEVVKDPTPEPAAESIPAPTANRTWRRLLETTQFVLDCMESKGSMTPPSLSSEGASEGGGLGWQSSVRVRLLHSSVRSRITKLASNPNSKYSIERDGIPINQEDLAATLASFSSAPLWCLQRMGMAPSPLERNQFIALWRHVGFFMGVEPAILRRCFGDEKKADRFLFSSVRHLFGEEEVGSVLDGPTIPVLRSCADRPPFHTKLKIHFALAR